MTDHGGAASPRTEAGKRLDTAWPGTHLDRLDWNAAIRAIEAEAAQEAPAPEGLRLDHHWLTHLIAKVRGREDAIRVADNRLAEILMSEMKAAGLDVNWPGPSPEHYGTTERESAR